MLHPIKPIEAQRIIDGSGRANGEEWHPEYPFVDELVPLRGLAAQIAPHPVFTLYQLRLRESGLAIGGIGFFGPPDAHGSVEVGYGLVAAERGHGYATEALLCMLDIAVNNGAQEVIADTDLDKVAGMF